MIPGENVANDIFLFDWSLLPTVSAQIPGTGGVIRQALGDFQVTELPLYEPSGQGSHTYAWVEKRAHTTRELVSALVGAGVPERRIGVAGLKDKWAITRQWLSVPKRFEHAWGALDELPGVEILRTSRHTNKLGIGHLHGNRFVVRVREVAPGAWLHAEQVLELLGRTGVPNYFGPQRFGRHRGNALDGVKLLRGEVVPGGHRLKRFFLSALQSQLFNQMLKLRIERGVYDRVWTGEWAKRHDTGGTFVVDDELAEIPRAARLEISALLPLFGKKVRISEGQAGLLERDVLTHFGLRWVQFTARRGARRFSRVPLSDARVRPADGGYELTFSLPKGSFATVVVREVTKTPVDEPTLDDDASV